MTIGMESIFSTFFEHNLSLEYSIKIYSVTEHSGLAASIRQPLLPPLPHMHTTRMFASNLMYEQFYFVTGSRKR